MDVLLIYPGLSVDERYGNKRLGRIGGYLPPLGLAYIASVLRNQGFAVGIIDEAASNLRQDDILRQIEGLTPRVIGISAITPLFHRAVRLAEIIRKEFPRILILIGGHHASILPVQILQENPFFDLVVYGEGEFTMWELMEKYRQYNFNRDRFLGDFESLKQIPGIVFRKQNDVVISSPRPLIENLDILPYPAWDLLPMDKYIPLPNQYLRKPVLHMVAIRGCPYQCSFCSNSSVFGKEIRAISPSKLVEIIKYAKVKFGAREISFWDDSMTVNRKWMQEFCQYMLKEDLDITWTCYSRVDTVTKELLFEMKKAGCWNIFYGYETGNQELLDIIGKNITLDQIRQVNSWTKEAGIEVRASFMLALPGETPEMAKKTIDFAISLEPDYAQFCITTPFPGTKLYRDAQRYGFILNDFSKYNIWEPVFIPYGYRDIKQIKKIAKTAFRRFYFRHKYIWGRLKRIKSFSEIWRYLKGLRFALGFAK